MITSDPEAALAELSKGGTVVLIVAEAPSSTGGMSTPGVSADPEQSVGRADHLGGWSEDQIGSGRLAIMVGDRSDPAVMAAAQEMHDELFSTRR